MPTLEDLIKELKDVTEAIKQARADGRISLREGWEITKEVMEAWQAISEVIGEFVQQEDDRLKNGCDAADKPA